MSNARDTAKNLKTGLNVSSFGNVVDIQKDGTSVGKLGIQTSGFYIDGESGHEGIRFGNGSVNPRENGADSDGTSALGTSSARWSNLYLSGSAYIDGTMLADAITSDNVASGDGDDYAAVALNRDYSAWAVIYDDTWIGASTGWGSFWAGSANALYRRVSGDNNPNEHVLVGAGQKRFTFDLDVGGHAYFDGSLSQNNYDYAEYFEWKDGNPDNEDRRGYSVVLTSDGKIQKASSEDDAENIIGVISGTAAVIGDAAMYDWQGKYEVDEWGTPIVDTVDQLTWKVVDAKGNVLEKHSYDEDRVPDGVVVPDDVQRKTRKRNRITKSFDASLNYVPRDMRKEWGTVGLLGKVRVREDSPKNPRWIKIKVVDGKELWLIR